MEINKAIREFKQSNVSKKSKSCPYCLVSLKSENYKLHISQKCPKRNKQSFVEDKKQSQETARTLVEKPLLTNLRSDIKLSIEKFPWTLLPEGEWLFKEVIKHFRYLSSTKKWKNKSIDETRFHKIEKFLKPNKCFVGNDEFEGYIRPYAE